MTRFPLSSLAPIGFATLSVVALVALSACSDNKSTYGGTNPPPSGREFVSGNLAGNGASFSHVFATGGTYPYYCRYHGAAGGVGMSGVITVSGNGAASTHNFSITGSTLPDATIDVGDTVRWTNNSGVVHTVESDN